MPPAGSTARQDPVYVVSDDSGLVYSYSLHYTMPESLVVAHFHHEIMNPPWIVKSRSKTQIASGDAGA